MLTTLTILAHLATQATAPTIAVPQPAAPDGAAPRAPPKFDELVAPALRDAAKTKRNVLVVFGAAWCEPCKVLNAWLDEPKTAEVLARSVVRVYVDEDVIVDAVEKHASFGDKLGSIPYLVVLDAKGKKRATFEGCPETLDEARDLLQRLDAHASARMSKAEKQQLSSSLVDRVTAAMH